MDRTGLITRAENGKWTKTITDWFSYNKRKQGKKKLRCMVLLKCLTRHHRPAEDRHEWGPFERGSLSPLSMLDNNYHYK